MPVTTTVQDILNGAYGKSAKNAPGKLATDATELVETVARSLRGLYALAARINPYFFGETAVVAFSSGWARPAAAESIVRIESVTSEVGVVPLQDKQADEANPNLYRFGQKYYSAGNANDPVSGNLTFYYSKRADKPSATTSTLDALWVEQFNELLILEVALYLAIKDGRDEELPGLKLERDRWLRLFVAFLEHETANERRRWDNNLLNSPTLIALSDLVAGGTSVFDRRVAA